MFNKNLNTQYGLQLGTHEAPKQVTRSNRNKCRDMKKRGIGTVSSLILL